MRSSTERSRRILHEIAAREVYDQHQEDEEQAARIALWHDDDHGDDHSHTDAAGTGNEALIRADSFDSELSG